MKLVVFLALISVSSAALYNVSIKGTAICNSRRLENVNVKLMEKDTFTADDNLGEVNTNRDGEFTIFGQEDESFGFEPYILFTHNCNVKDPKCKRVTKFEIPKTYVGGVYDLTYVTLDIVQYEDKEKC